MSFLVSLLFGVAIGAAYALAGVKSPAPPIVALFGLLGIVIGEQGAAWLKNNALRQGTVEVERRANLAPPDR